MKIGFIDIRIFVSTLAALTIAGTVAAQQVGTGSAWQNEDAEFSRYDKVLIKPLDISDVIVKKPTWEQDDPEEWAFTPGISKEVQALFMENMSREIAASDGYEVVDYKAENVLQIEVELLSITPYVKPGTRVDSAPGYEVSTLGSGDITLSAEVRDSLTGTMLYFVEGERKIGTEYKELSPENHRENLVATFSQWGKRVRDFLDDSRK